jgi:hypothetical protein
MEWLQYASYVLAGALLTDAVPHFVSGVMGRPFQSPSRNRLARACPLQR